MKLKVSWDAMVLPANSESLETPSNGGYDITEFKILLKSTSGSYSYDSDYCSSTSNDALNSQFCEFTFSTFYNNFLSATEVAEWSCKLIAVNSAGSSEESDASNTLSLAGRPDKPTGLVFTAGDSPEEIFMSWTPPQFYGLTPVGRYEVYIRYAN